RAVIAKGDVRPWTDRRPDQKWPPRSAARIGKIEVHGLASVGVKLDRVLIPRIAAGIGMPRLREYCLIKTLYRSLQCKPHRDRDAPTRNIDAWTVRYADVLA